MVGARKTTHKMINKTDKWLVCTQNERERAHALVRCCWFVSVWELAKIIAMRARPRWLLRLPDSNVMWCVENDRLRLRALYQSFRFAFCQRVRVHILCGAWCLHAIVRLHLVHKSHRYGRAKDAQRKYNLYLMGSVAHTYAYETNVNSFVSSFLYTIARTIYRWHNIFFTFSTRHLDGWRVCCFRFVFVHIKLHLPVCRTNRFEK